MDQTDVIARPYKTELKLDVREGDGPDAPTIQIITNTTWHEADGTVITDPARIAELDTRAGVDHG